MIEKLTEEQTKELEVYKEKWIRIGLDTTPIMQAEAERICGQVETKILTRDKPSQVRICASPVQAWNLILVLSSFPNLEVPMNWQEINRLITEYLPKSKKENFVYPFTDGNCSSGYFAFYSYANEVLEIKYEKQELWNIYKETSKLSLQWYCDGWVIISQKPTVIRLDTNNRLHSDGKAAIEYLDGWQFFALHGVTVDEKWVMTPAEKLEVGELLKVENLDVRRELIRKIGIERFIVKTGAKTLDKMGDYELLEINLEPIKDAKFLKMKNPSINTWHVEGVDKSCNTVQAALDWRAKQVLPGDEKWNPSEVK